MSTAPSHVIRLLSDKDAVAVDNQHTRLYACHAFDDDNVVFLDIEQFSRVNWDRFAIFSFEANDRLSVLRLTLTEMALMALGVFMPLTVSLFERGIKHDEARFPFFKREMSRAALGTRSTSNLSDKYDQVTVSVRMVRVSLLMMRIPGRMVMPSVLLSLMIRMPMIVSVVVCMIVICVIVVCVIVVCVIVACVIVACVIVACMIVACMIVACMIVVARRQIGVVRWFSKVGPDVEDTHHFGRFGCEAKRRLIGCDRFGRALIGCVDRGLFAATGETTHDAKQGNESSNGHHLTPIVRG